MIDAPDTHYDRRCEARQRHRARRAAQQERQAERHQFEIARAKATVGGEE